MTAPAGPTTGPPGSVEPGSVGPGSAGPAELGRRERKKLATRTALREAALRLAVADGVAGVTVERIAAEADVAIRTFFNHFSGKEEAIVAAAAGSAEQLVEEFRGRPADESVLVALREAAVTVLDRDDRISREYLQVLHLVRRTPSLLPQQMAMQAAQETALAAAVAKRLDDRVPDPGYPRLCAATALAALRVVLDRWLDGAADHAGPPPRAMLRAGITDALGRLAAGMDAPLRTP